MIKAVCVCKAMAEANPVLAVKRERFAFIDEWGSGTLLMVVILALATGGAWLSVIAAYHLEEILNPKYHCNQCNAVIPQKQFRT